MKEISFSVEKFTYSDLETINVEFLPKILKRRLDNLDKNVFYLLNQVFDEDIEIIFFSSRYGEFERLNKLINQYKELNEVSPNTFSSSVHNYSVGLFSIFKKKIIPIQALSACENTFSNGLLNALLSSKNKILFCFATSENGICFKIDKTKKDFKLIKETNNIKENVNNFIDFINNKEKEIIFPIYKIERTING